MTKLLNTRLPLASTDVDTNTFNRLVRVLEINLESFDPDSTPQFNDSDITTLAFNAGDVIWNTSIDVLQVYSGNRWIQLHTPVNPQGYELQALVGSVTITTAGNTTINLGTSSEYWNIEKWYT
jgi:hypothetical protein|tara:strand:+ start:1798 stop:2166 length:369 start_codon:yes stop_codon:yes gene_type:complete